MTEKERRHAQWKAIRDVIEGLDLWTELYDDLRGDGWRSPE